MRHFIHNQTKVITFILKNGIYCARFSQQTAKEEYPSIGEPSLGFDISFFLFCYFDIDLAKSSNSFDRFDRWKRNTSNNNKQRNPEKTHIHPFANCFFFFISVRCFDFGAKRIPVECGFIELLICVFFCCLVENALKKRGLGVQLGQRIIKLTLFRRFSFHFNQTQILMWNRYFFLSTSQKNKTLH